MSLVGYFVVIWFCYVLILLVMGHAEGGVRRVGE